ASPPQPPVAVTASPAASRSGRARGRARGGVELCTPTGCACGRGRARPQPTPCTRPPPNDCSTSLAPHQDGGRGPGLRTRASAAVPGRYDGGREPPATGALTTAATARRLVAASRGGSAPIPTSRLRYRARSGHDGP